MKISIRTASGKSFKPTLSAPKKDSGVVVKKKTKTTIKKKTIKEGNTSSTTTTKKKVVFTQKKTMTNTEVELPFFIIVRRSEYSGERYQLIHKKTLACLSAQNTLEDLLECVTKMTDRCKHSFNKLKVYLDDAYLSTEYDLKPEPTVFAERKGLINNDYDSELWDAIHKSENKVA